MKTAYFLYAEDDPDDVELLREALSREHKTVRMVSVADGYELLAYLQAVKKFEPYPSLIILDLQLPRLNGIETLQLLRTDDLYRLIPAVILSSHASASEMASCRSLGADMLGKPDEHQKWGPVIDKICGYIDA